MKTIIIFLCVMSAIFASPIYYNRIQGNWQLTSQCGGWSGCITSGFAYTNMTIIASSSSTDSLIVSYFRNDSSLKTISFSRYDTGIPSFGDNSLKRTVDLNTDTSLVLSDLLIDGIISTYKKLPLKTENLNTTKPFCHISPNPSGSILTITTAFDQISINIFALNGKLLKSIKDINGKATVNLQAMGIAPGQYLLKIEANGQVINNRIVVTRGK